MSLSITEQLQYATVRIVVALSNGEQSTGTGFFFILGGKGTDEVSVIVTNKHVLEGGRSATLKLRERKGADG